MYLRRTRATDPHGQSVSYLQLAHNRRNPLTGAPTAEIIHSFGRADREGLARLVRSITLSWSPGRRRRPPQVLRTITRSSSQSSSSLALHLSARQQG